MDIKLQPNITGKNVNIIKGATQADLTNSVNNSKIYRDEAEAFSIVSEAKSVEASYSALNASISSTTASDKATIATTKANEANNSAINASASEAVCIAKATIATDNANIATAQSVIATDKANEASVSANTATTQAGIATTKASEASTSASNALTSENNADTSEANALIYRNQAESFANSINPSNLVHISGTETITGNKTFSGTVSGLTKATVGLSNVDNTSDSAKNVLYATTAGTASANDVYAWAKASVKPTYTASEVGLGNVTNESKATMFTNSTLTGTVTLPSTTSIGTVSSAELGYLDGVTSAIQTQINGKAATNQTMYIGTTAMAINRATAAQTLTGVSIDGNSATATTAASCSGNSATATKLTNSSGDWVASGAIANVVGMLSWKNYGNGHVIFDASAGTAPNGAAINNTNSAVAWSPSYPTLMGWNGSQTYGVRVDAARVADAFSTTSGSAPSYACRAWVNFNGTGTVAIRASGNVSSITDNGVGLFTINFTNPLPDTNYIFTSAGTSSTNTDRGQLVIGENISITKTTSALPIRTVFGYDATSFLLDIELNQVAIFR